jgi:hypothetical protein
MEWRRTPKESRRIWGCFGGERCRGRGSAPVARPCAGEIEGRSIEVMHLRMRTTSLFGLDPTQGAPESDTSRSDSPGDGLAGFSIP